MSIRKPSFVLIQHIHKQTKKIQTALAADVKPDIVIIGDSESGYYGGIRLTHARVGPRVYLLSEKQFPRRNTLKDAREFAITQFGAKIAVKTKAIPFDHNLSVTGPRLAA